MDDEHQPKITPDRERRVVAPDRTSTAESPGRLRQEDVHGVVQASDTAHGIAVPINPPDRELTDSDSASAVDDSVR
jgi:hypothetical protein